MIMQVRVTGYKYDAPTELQTSGTLCLLLLLSPKTCLSHFTDRLNPACSTHLAGNSVQPESRCYACRAKSSSRSSAASNETAPCHKYISSAPDPKYASHSSCRDCRPSQNNIPP